MSESKYRLRTGLRHHFIFEGDEVVWKCPRTGIENLRKAQAKLRDYRTGEKIERLANRMAKESKR